MPSTPKDEVLTAIQSLREEVLNRIDDGIGSTLATMEQLTDAHDHATCETCQQANQTAKAASMLETVKFYEGIPGVTDNRARYELGRTVIVP